MKIDFDSGAVKLPIHVALAYGVAYAGRSYLHINPLHVALFTAATAITNLLARKLAVERFGFKNYSLLTRSMNFFSQYTPAGLAIASKVFSPVQAITAIGIWSMTSNLYFAITGRLARL